MTGSVTTNLSNSFLGELLSAGHCLMPPQAAVACTCSSTTAMVLTSAQAGIAVGMAVTGTNAASNTVVGILSATAANMTIYPASTGALTSATFTGDVIKIALIGSALSGGIAYGAGGTGSLTTNAGVPGTGTPTQANLGTDEASGTGYTPGGLAIVPLAIAATNPVNSGAVGFTTTIQWTGATISTAGAMIYNTTARLSAAATPVAGRVAAVYSFGGTQSVTSGTLTLTQPTQDGHTGLIRLSPN